MKKNALFVLGMLVSLICFTQSSYSQNDTSNFDPVGGTQLENFLLGTKYTLQNSGQLTSINLLGKASGAKVKLAVYSDNNNVPGDLIASTKAVTIKNGLTSISVSTKTISEGDYWIMAVYNTTGNHTYSNMDVAGKDVYFTPLDFKNKLPASAKGFEKSDRGSELAYSLGIKVDASLGIKESSVKVYPNPASNYVFVVNGGAPISKIQIKDFAGNSIKNVNAKGNTSVRINTSSLPKGIYFVVVDNNNSRQIIKK